MDSKYWRGAAEEARLYSEQMRDPVAKETLRRIAEQYDRFALNQERREKSIREGAIGVLLAMTILFAIPAHAQQWRTDTFSDGSSITYGPGGPYRTDRYTNGDSTTYSPHGEYRTDRFSSDSVTYGSPGTDRYYVPPSVFNPNDSHHEDDDDE